MTTCLVETLRAAVRSPLSQAVSRPPPGDRRSGRTGVWSGWSAPTMPPGPGHRRRRRQVDDVDAIGEPGQEAGGRDTAAADRARRSRPAPAGSGPTVSRPPWPATTAAGPGHSPSLGQRHDPYGPSSKRRERSRTSQRPSSSSGSKSWAHAVHRLGCRALSWGLGYPGRTRTCNLRIRSRPTAVRVVARVPFLLLRSGIGSSRYGPVMSCRAWRNDQRSDRTASPRSRRAGIA